MIKVKHLSKRYDQVQAVKSISFEVKENAFFALLGPNGAGKSTTIEIISTLLSSEAGEVTVNNYVLGEEDDEIRKSIGVVFQYSTLDSNLTVKENLKIRAAFYHMDEETFKQRYEALDEKIQFSKYENQRLKTLSGGQRRKVDIARALLHNPKILILDEPTTGLDPKSRKEIWSLILSLKAETNMTIFLTTHYMEEVLDADHVIIMHHGEILAEDSADNLRIKYAQDTLKLVASEAIIEVLKQDNVVYKRVNNFIHIPLKTPFEGITYIEKYKDLIETFEIIKASMDDVFLNITGRSLEDDNGYTQIS